MDRVQLLTLIEEAETRLAGARAWLLVGAQTGSLDLEIDSPGRSIEALGSKALNAGFAEIAEIANDLAVHFDAPLANSTGAAAQHEIRRLLDAVVKAEARIASIRFETEDAPIDVASFVERSFDFLQRDADLEKNDAKDNFEIDSEMLEIFLSEAEELVANIDDNLSNLRDDPSNSHALWEIRRSTHTFKGAAGIVGLRKPSELAHRIEDLIDRFSDDRLESKDRITGLLMQSVDCLRALTNGENSGGLVERIEKLYADFDDLLASGAQSPATDTAAEGPTLEHPKQPPQPLATVPQVRQIVRISQKRLDELFRIVCDLVVSRTIFEQRLSDFELQIDDINERTRKLQDVAERSESSDAMAQMLSMNASLYTMRDSLAMLFEHQRQLVEQIHEKLVGIRMAEFGSIAGRLQRAVRNTCAEEGKLAEISIENEKLEIDTQIIDQLIEPLMHLLKNAVVHGIESRDIRRLLGKPETGQIRLRAVNDETHIIFTVTDDGAGIVTNALRDKAVSTGHLTSQAAEFLSEKELVDLVFLTGVTTAEKLTMNAGRGVGMNIVRQSIESRQGTIEVESTPRSGTTFTIKMPLPMTVSKVLIVTAAGERYAIPMRLIKNVGERSSLTVESDANGQYVKLGRDEYPVIGLDDLLHSAGARQNTEAPLILFIGSERFRVALAVETVLWSDEILFNPLGKLAGSPELSGEGILGDNSKVPIPDLELLVRNYKPRPEQPPVIQVERSDNMVMIIDDSPSVRYLVSKLVEGIGCIVETANDGKDALTKMGLTKQQPALIISDIEMPRMDGLEFLAFVKNDPTLKDIPVIMLTSRSGEQSRTRIMELGAADYILKPFEDSRLLDAVEGFVAAPVRL